MQHSIPEISVVTPVFNEEEVVRTFCDRMSTVLDRMSLPYELIFVDDGSRDRSFELLQQIHDEQPGVVRVVRLARNFGHQLAITAGLRHARGRAVIVLDCDLQDPPELVPSFVERWREGYEVVYGRRSARKGETWFKRFTAGIFYWILDHVASVRIPRDVGDFYLLDRKVVDVLGSMEERHRFIRGLVAWVGFRRVAVDYVREPRFAGVTKYGLFRMIQFSLDALTAFSFAPLRFISLCGAGISFLSFLGILWVFILKIVNPAVVLGWSSLMVAVLFIGGIQLLAIGLIGEYLARIGDDVKHRPLYTIQDVLE